MNWLIHDGVFFWTYAAIAEGGGRGRRLIVEIVVNILMMIPIEVFAPVVISKRKLLVTLVIGATLSVSIELLQFVTQRGLCELDEILHNMIGVLIGFGIYKCLENITNKNRTKNR